MWSVSQLGRACGMLVSEPSELNCVSPFFSSGLVLLGEYRIVTAVASRPPAAPTWALLSALDL